MIPVIWRFPVLIQAVRPVSYPKTLNYRNDWLALRVV
jgi:hypothetical protein